MINTFDEAKKVIPRNRVKFYEEAKETLSDNLWKSIEKDMIKQARSIEKSEQELKKNSIHFMKYFQKAFNVSTYDEMINMVDELSNKHSIDKSIESLDSENIQMRDDSHE